MHATAAALMASKSQLGELSQVRALYVAAREELDRMEKENAELKDMVQAGGVAEVGRSRWEAEALRRHGEVCRRNLPRDSFVLIEGWCCSSRSGSSSRSRDPMPSSSRRRCS